MLQRSERCQQQPYYYYYYYSSNRRGCSAHWRLAAVGTQQWLVAERTWFACVVLLWDVGVSGCG